MIYKRPQSIETTLKDYQNYFGSIKNALKRCFNIGAGTWQHDAWTNIDLPPQTEAFGKIQAPCIYHDSVKYDTLPG